ncbi:sugar kinase [Sporosarcina sp. FSL K6-6792]|uniref:sugar kinase n=1 Tax=Sporosarcina sp. FSL K6-6792 TaxID=2921559 RepID=UPI0030FBDEB7
MRQTEVLTFGEAMTMFIAKNSGDLRQVSEYTKAMAGAETNVSIGLSRLDHFVKWVSKVGDDSFGTYIMKTLESEGVDISSVQIDYSNPTGFQLKSRVENGDPVVEYFRKNSAASKMSIEDFQMECLTEAKHLHMTGIPLALSKSVREFSLYVLQSMKAAGRTVSFDPNLRPSLWKSEEEMIEVINDVAFQADWVLPGIKEGRILTGYQDKEDIVDFYLNMGVKLVVVKLGEAGAYFATPTEREVVSGFKVDKVVDTVGAGDGFAVGVISGITEGLAVREAVARGNAIGALAVMSAGDSDGLPTRTQLDHFMKRGVLVK